MISVKEAQEKILETVSPRGAVVIPLEKGRGRYLAEGVRARLDSPAFDNAAMDGYALRADETADAAPERQVRLSVVQTVAAGTRAKGTVQPGEAARIFTGAPVPAGTDAVVKQEEVRRAGEYLYLTQPVPAGANLRRRGEEFRLGDTLLPQGTALSPAALGLLASQGLFEVPIFSPPRVGILVTGSEIVTREEEWEEGKIFDSNSFSLRAALEELRLQADFVRHCRDRRDELGWAIAESLEAVDFLLVTGGVSVGDFDFVREAAEGIGVRPVFWQVRQKPGKPIFFGKKSERQFLFGLPGNPVSALVCFYEYCRPALLRAMGAAHPFLPTVQARLQEAFRKNNNQAHFMRGIWREGEVHLPEQQGSHMMQSFSQANCLVVVGEDQRTLLPGDPVNVHLLPGVFD